MESEAAKALIQIRFSDPLTRSQDYNQKFLLRADGQLERQDAIELQ